MLQLQYLREHTEEAKTRISKRNPTLIAVINEVLDLDEQTRAARLQMETNQSEANKLAKQIGELMKSGNKEEA
jgi:seryl-tRNA synthetase